MTTEQLKEFVEVLSVLSTKSSVLKERDELHHLMEENQQAASEEAEVILLLNLVIANANCPINRTRKRLRL